MVERELNKGLTSVLMRDLLGFKTSSGRDIEDHGSYTELFYRSQPFYHSTVYLPIFYHFAPPFRHSTTDYYVSSLCHSTVRFHVSTSCLWHCGLWMIVTSRHFGQFPTKVSVVERTVHCRRLTRLPVPRLWSDPSWHQSFNYQTCNQRNVVSLGGFEPLDPLWKWSPGSISGQS